MRRGGRGNSGRPWVPAVAGQRPIGVKLAAGSTHHDVVPSADSGIVAVSVCAARLVATLVGHTHGSCPSPKADICRRKRKAFGASELLEARCFLLDIVGRRNLALLVNVTGNEAFPQLAADSPRAFVNKLLVVIGPDTEIL